MLGSDNSMEHSEDLELFHYGVKGMKWGVQRKLDKEGLVVGPPPAKKQKENLKTQGKSLGSQDRTVEKGREILYVSDKKYREGVSNRLYSSYTKADKSTYSDLIASMGDSGKVYHNTFKIKKDLKIPSDQKAAEVFSKMAKENPGQVSRDMAKAYKARVGLPLKSAKHFQKKISELDSDVSGKADKLYTRYNKMLVVDMKSSNDFYSRLSKEGYGALSDLNDRGKVSQDPLVVFNPDRKLKNVSSVPLSKSDVDSYMDYTLTKKYKQDQNNFEDVRR